MPTRAPKLLSFHHAATTQIYTLSLHDALPIYGRAPHRVPAHPELVRAAAQQQDRRGHPGPHQGDVPGDLRALPRVLDRKSTRLNSSHMSISYAVFCLKKKKEKQYA